MFFLVTLSGVNDAKTTNVIPPWLAFILEVGRDPIQLEFDFPFHLEPHKAKMNSPLAYLDRGKNYSVTIEKPSCATDTSIRFCVKSEIEKSKCLALQLAAIGRRILPKVDCILGESNLDCINKIAEGEADLINLSPKGNFFRC